MGSQIVGTTHHCATVAICTLNEICSTCYAATKYLPRECQNQKDALNTTSDAVDGLVADSKIYCGET